MLFTTLEFAEFFGLVFVVSWGLARVPTLRIFFLLAASYFFYAWWDYRFLPLIFLSSSADWLLGNVIFRSRDARKKRLWLTATVVLNLGVLGFFKYANFGVSSARAVLESLGVHPPELALQVVLPVGVSFFTFESMSYVIDIYRGRIEPSASYVRYLTFVAFFPHLIAGPIVRASDLLPQLAAPPKWEDPRETGALVMIGVGLVKKLGVSDMLALNFVDRVFDAPERFSALECYVAVVAYAVQIYCDFSGYTDMAIGCARLLGIRLPTNFDAPYKATSIRDFWRRWHISLSSWLRDYLYIPLGGNRRGEVRTYVNIMITMLLGGLWHGANWTFVAWGGLHGLGLVTNRLLGESSVTTRTLPRRVLSVTLTFHFVCLAWIFFRAGTFHAALSLLRQLTTLTTSHALLSPRPMAVLLLALLVHWMPAGAHRLLRGGLSRLPVPAQGVALLAAALLLREADEGGAIPFLYFQF